jgi:hypothetical protein
MKSWTLGRQYGNSRPFHFHSADGELCLEDFKVELVIVLDDVCERSANRVVNETYGLDVFDFPLELLVLCLVLGILSSSGNAYWGLLLPEP